MAPPSRRDDVVQAALRLFLRDGFHATGIAAILAEAGVNKMTLYNHFASKDDLILAALEVRDERFRTWLFGRMAELAPGDAGGQVLALFTALGEWFAGESSLDARFGGCAFVKVAGEYGDGAHPAHRAAKTHKDKIVASLEDLCRQAGLSDPAHCARQLALLKEGAIAEAFVRGQVQCWKTAQDMARRLLGL